MRRGIVSIVLFVAMSFSLGILQAQGIKNLRINEVLVFNDSNCIDEFGERCGWIEIYNIGYSTVNLGGCFVTNDPSNPRKYRIPKNDNRVYIAPQTFVLLYASNEDTRGIFHLNFTMDEAIDGRGYFALYDQSGAELIDSVSYNIADQKPGVSFGRMESFTKEDGSPAKLIDIKNDREWHIYNKPTPKAMNAEVDMESRSDKYGKKDPHGFIITLTSMSVVFTLLLLVAVVFMLTGKYFKRQLTKKQTLPEESTKITQESTTKNTVADNDMAAVAMTLHLYFNDLHEIEPMGFNLSRGLNQTTPWANKSFVLKKSPNRK